MSASIVRRTARLSFRRSTGISGSRLRASKRVQARTTRWIDGLIVYDRYEWILDMPGCDAKRTSGTYQGVSSGDDVHGEWQSGGQVLKSLEDDPCAAFDPINLSNLFQAKGKQELIIGRDVEQVDAFVDFDTVSRQHVKISLENHGDKLYVTDLGTTNGTELNGTKLKPKEKTELCGGDVISLAGDCQLEVYRNIHAHA